MLTILIPVEHSDHALPCGAREHACRRYQALEKIAGDAGKMAARHDAR